MGKWHWQIFFLKVVLNFKSWQTADFGTLLETACLFFLPEMTHEIFWNWISLEQSGFKGSACGGARGCDGGTHYVVLTKFTSRQCIVDNTWSALLEQDVAVNQKIIEIHFLTRTVHLQPVSSLFHTMILCSHNNSNYFFYHRIWVIKLWGNTVKLSCSNSFIASLPSVAFVWLKDHLN